MAMQPIGEEKVGTGRLGELREIALLVVHGIGSQKRGETLASCARALQCAHPSAQLTDNAGSSISISDIFDLGTEEIILQQSSWRVRLYEVYWADILQGSAVTSSFSKFLFEETTWFP